MLKNTALALAALLPLAACNDDGNQNLPKRDLTFYVTDGASLYSLNSDRPLNVRKDDFTGLNGGTLIVAMDFNPKGNVLNGLGSDGQSYTIDAAGGLTRRGSPDTTVSFANKRVEIDYNPMVANQQVYRVVTDLGDNYRRNDTTGAKVATDTGFAYRTGDVNAGKGVVASGIAYTNSQLNATATASTTAYVIDSQNDVLAILGGNPASATAGDPRNPNGGQLTTVGSLGFDLVGEIGFDIQGANTGYVTAFGSGTYNLYAIDLATGKMTFITAVNPKVQPVKAFAIPQS